MYNNDIDNEVERRFNIIMSFAEECISPNELKNKIKNSILNNVQLIAYDGMEPSGKLHIAHGILRSINTNKLIDAGFKFKFYIADWFAKMNMKYGGDMNKIHNSGIEMMIIWDACGMDLQNVEFIWASEEITKRADEYWKLILDISTKFNINNILDCSPKSLKIDNDNLASSQVLYPIMQCADIFFLNADICSLGMDQRKVNILARDYCEKINNKNKPILIHHHMLLGTDGNKMSKSKPEYAIFMEDSNKDIKKKINKAVPIAILDYFKYIIFELEKDGIIINNTLISDYNLLLSNYHSNNIDITTLKEICLQYILKYINLFKERLKNNIY